MMSHILREGESPHEPHRAQPANKPALHNSIPRSGTLLYLSETHTGRSPLTNRPSTTQFRAAELRNAQRRITSCKRSLRRQESSYHQPCYPKLKYRQSKNRCPLTSTGCHIFYWRNLKPIQAHQHHNQPAP